MASARDRQHRTRQQIILAANGDAWKEALGWVAVEAEAANLKDG
jgi:hypothetical protein